MSPICWLIRRRLDAYADAELPPGARARVERHLRRCRACASEHAGLGRLRTLLAAEAPEPPEPVWDAFWPQVRARIAVTPPPVPRWRRLAGGVAGHRRLAIGSALAAGALGVLAVLAPWQPVPPLPVVQPPGGIVTGPGPETPGESALQVVVQSVETADPDSSAMVFAHPGSDMTVLWVFGLARTGS